MCTPVIAEITYRDCGAATTTEWRGGTCKITTGGMLALDFGVFWWAAPLLLTRLAAVTCCFLSLSKVTHKG